MQIGTQIHTWPHAHRPPAPPSCVPLTPGRPKRKPHDTRSVIRYRSHVQEQPTSSQAPTVCRPQSELDRGHAASSPRVQVPGGSPPRELTRARSRVDARLAAAARAHLLPLTLAEACLREHLVALGASAQVHRGVCVRRGVLIASEWRGGRTRTRHSRRRTRGARSCSGRRGACGARSSDARLKERQQVHMPVLKGQIGRGGAG